MNQSFVAAINAATSYKPIVNPFWLARLYNHIQSGLTLPTDCLLSCMLAYISIIMVFTTIIINKSMQYWLSRWHVTTKSSPEHLPSKPTKTVQILESYINLVFLVGIWLVFLSIYQTDTRGKLGRYIWVFFLQEPLFSSKGGSWPPFWGAQPPFWSKKGFPPNLKEFPPNSLVLKLPTKILTDQYQYMVYQYRYLPSCHYQNGIQL